MCDRTKKFIVELEIVFTDDSENTKKYMNENIKKEFIDDELEYLSSEAIFKRSFCVEAEDAFEAEIKARGDAYEKYRREIITIKTCKVIKKYQLPEKIHYAVHCWNTCDDESTVEELKEDLINDFDKLGYKVEDVQIIKV